jgi:cell division protein FtsL
VNIITALPAWPKISLFLQKIFGKLIAKFNKLPASSKVLLVTTLVLLMLFSQSVIWLHYKNIKEDNIEKFNQTIIDVENKKNDAESSLIYRDENQARELLAEAKSMLENLDPPLKSQKEQINMLLNDIKNKLNELQHIIQIDSPSRLVNFQDQDQEANIGLFLSLNSGNLYVQNQTNQSIYKFNLENKNVSEIKLPTNVGKLLWSTDINENEIFFFNESNASFILNPQDESISDAKISLNNNSGIADIASYNGRLYLLDAINNQIYRYSKITGGYGNQSSWTKEKIDLQNSASLTIDGSIYVIKKDGEIIQMLNGNKTDFRTNLIDPKIESASKIKTNDTSEYLYILDPPSKRLIVVNKEGELISQYTSNQFDNLKDMVIAEEKKEIYILNGNSIFTIQLSHLGN